MSKYLVTDKDGNGHLPVRDTDDGPLNHHLMGAAWAALHGGYRGNKYEGPNKEEALRKLKALYKSEGMELPSEQGSGFGGQGSGGKPTINLFSRGLRLQLDEPILAGGKSLYPLTVCVTGTWVKNGHKFSITPDDLAAMARNFEKRKNEQIVIDYEHASEQPEVAKGGPVPAAGWIHELKVENGNSKMPRPDEVSGENGKPISNFQFPVSLGALVEWTPLARDLIAGGQYRFFSPAIDWSYTDKESGKPQGATLTSGALTNHPFLEELPAITLADSDSIHNLADTSTGYLDSPLKTVSVAYRQGAKMKKLSIKKLDGDEFGAAQGHHGIFDGEDMMGYVHNDEMRDHVKKNADDFDDLFEGKGQAGVKGHQDPDADDKRLSELLRDSGFGIRDSEKPQERILAGLKLASTHQLVEQREASRNLLLTECLVASQQSTVDSRQFNTEKAKQLLRDGKINAADLLDAIEARGCLDDAVAKGKVLPKDRAFFFEIAFNNPKKFSDYIAGAVPVVRLGTIGLGSTEQVPVDQEVDLETKKLMSEKRLSYGKAMKELFRANPQLEDRYRAAHRQEVKQDTAAAARVGASSGITQ